MLPAGPFRDRAEAGRLLGDALVPQGEGDDVVVLGLARGGVPVAAEVAERLGAPLDALVVRKLGVPAQPEFGFGAIAENDAVVLDEKTVTMIGLSRQTIETALERESHELSRRARLYRGDRPLADVRDKTAILVDDGLATGVTMRAAVAFAKNRGAARVIVAVPVGAPESIATLQTEADVVCLCAPSDFSAVGYWYADFEAPTDDEIRALLTPSAGG